MHNPCILTVGDHARVREWDDMEKEYGSDGLGICIAPGWELFNGLRKYCGKEVRVIKVTPYDIYGLSNFYAYEVVDDSTGEPVYQTFTSYDLEHLDCKCDHCVSRMLAALYEEVL